MIGCSKTVYVILQFIHCCIIGGRKKLKKVFFKKVSLLLCRIYVSAMSFCSVTFAICSVFQQWWIIIWLTRVISYLNLLYTFFPALCFSYIVDSVWHRYLITQWYSQVQVLRLYSSTAWCPVSGVALIILLLLATASTIHFWCPCYFHTDYSFYIWDVHYYKGQEHVE